MLTGDTKNFRSLATIYYNLISVKLAKTVCAYISYVILTFIIFSLSRQVSRVFVLVSMNTELSNLLSD